MTVSCIKHFIFIPMTELVFTVFMASVVYVEGKIIIQ